MFRHYVTIALRNIRKYAFQNAVSIIGLAAGFICLSLTTLWMHFEKSFDSFHKDADKLYFYYVKSLHGKSYMPSISHKDYEMLLDYPEIQDYCIFLIQYNDNDSTHNLCADKQFYDFFNIPIIAGSDKFRTDYKYIAITEDCAKRLYPGKNPIGLSHQDRTICAVVQDFGKRSNLKFDFVSFLPFSTLNGQDYLNDFPEFKGWQTNERGQIIIKVGSKADAKTLNEKLKKRTMQENSVRWYGVTPMTETRGMYVNNQSKKLYLTFTQLRTFALAGILLMACAIFNFLMYYIIRLRNREREMALRIVHGASGLSIVTLMAVELGIIQLTALVIGVITVCFLKRPFLTIADIEMTGTYYLTSGILIIILLFIISTALCIAVARGVQHRAIHSTLSMTKDHLLRKSCIGLEICVSIMFLFIVYGMGHQMRHLYKSDWGVRVNDLAVLAIPQPGTSGRVSFLGNLYYPPQDDSETTTKNRRINESADSYLDRIDGQFNITDQLKRLACVESLSTGIGDMNDIFNIANYMNDEKCRYNGTEIVGVRYLDILGTETMDFMQMHISDGDIPVGITDKDAVAITRNLQKELGLGPVSDEPVITVELPWIKGSNINTSAGQQVSPEQISISTGTVSYTFRVIAIVDDIHPLGVDNDEPMMMFCTPGNRRLMPRQPAAHSSALITLKLLPGMKKDEIRRQVSNVMDETGLEYTLDFTEDYFYLTLNREKNLSKLILLLGIICLFISVSGIWTIISLNCQERRREIALRKIHGAHLRDILYIFVQEYGPLYLISSVVALISGYLIIHTWQRQYQHQATISWWIYVSIFAAMALVICITVGHRILKTAHENPADVIKSE